MGVVDRIFRAEYVTPKLKKLTPQEARNRLMVHGEEGIQAARELLDLLPADQPPERERRCSGASEDPEKSE
jgi:hypothetical protein